MNFEKNEGKFRPNSFPINERSQFVLSNIEASVFWRKQRYIKKLKSSNKIKDFYLSIHPTQGDKATKTQELLEMRRKRL